jgi:sulfur carrier protein
MQIYVNGDLRDFSSSTLSVQDLLRLLELEHKRIAVELNKQLVPRSQFTNTPLSAQDRIEIIHAVGGG